MDKNNIDYVLNIFMTLTSEIPEKVLYREFGDSFELETLEGIGGCAPAELQSDGWDLIGCCVATA